MICIMYTYQKSPENEKINFMLKGIHFRCFGLTLFIAYVNK